MEPKKLIPDAMGVYHCPLCSAAMIFKEGDPVSVVDGRLNMEDTEGRYVCETCNSIYKRLVNTEYYQHYDGPKKKVEDLVPVKLVMRANGVCQCPICASSLEFVEGQPVRIVDGKLNMADSEGRYRCKNCRAVYRRLVNTDYYQWYAE